MFDHVVIGGSFDVLHKGHKRFLETAFKVGERVSIGITSDDFARNIPSKLMIQNISPYAERLRDLKNFLTTELGKTNFRIMMIEDKFGDSIDNDKYQAIIVTSNTKNTAMEINLKRSARGARPLVVIECPIVLADDGKPISASRVRVGTIDRDGRLTKLVVGSTKSQVRKNILNIIKEMGSAYGYQISKEYKKRFGRKISLRLTYYHLRKGCEEELFQVLERRKQKGGFSWGPNSERIYYEIGPKGL